jgi:DNA invertase Pin-like site-specific DNA recombinase
MPVTAILIRERPGFCPKAQRLNAHECAARHGLPVGRTYVDDGRRPRRVRKALMWDAGTAFATLVAPSISDLGRNLGEVVLLIAKLRERGVRLIIADEANGIGDWIGTVGTALAETHVALRREALQQGREKAKARGVRFGRPPLAPEKLDRAMAALNAGAGVRAAARIAGISAASVVRLRAASVSGERATVGARAEDASNADGDRAIAA